MCHKRKCQYSDSPALVTVSSLLVMMLLTFEDVLTSSTGPLQLICGRYFQVCPQMFDELSCLCGVPVIIIVPVTIPLRPEKSILVSSDLRT